MTPTRGDSASRRPAGNGTQLEPATTARQRQRARSSQRAAAAAMAGADGRAPGAACPPRPAARRPVIAAGERNSIPGARRATRPREKAVRSDRRFGVVVLVLVAVVARIVVLVAREIDLVQHDGGRSWAGADMMVSSARSARRRRVISAPMTKVTPATAARGSPRR